MTVSIPLSGTCNCSISADTVSFSGFLITLIFPFVSIMAYATSCKEKTSFCRNCSNKSSMVIRNLRICFWSTLPSLIKIIGLPHTAFRNPECFTINADTTISAITKTAIGTIPLTRGCAVSCIGMAAMSEMSNVTTNSDVCNSLI